MNPRITNQRIRALTLIEVLVITALVIVLAALVYPGGSEVKKRAQRINCISNLNQIGLAYRIWEGDHNQRYPMSVSVTNGGAMELITTGNVAACFQVMSNELSTPKLLICPSDAEHVWATNFTSDFNNSRINYFVNLDATETYFRMFLSGDDNLSIGGASVKSGLLKYSTNASVAWDSGRHVLPNTYFWTPARIKFVGNIGFADGSVQELSTLALQQALEQTSIVTNRLAIP